MASNPTPDLTRPPQPSPVEDPRAGDRMNPYGSTRTSAGTLWIVGILVVLATIIALFWMREPPATTPNTGQTSTNNLPTQPVPVQPTPPQPTQP